MGDTTGIEWTDSTWNPIRGCSRVSEGCRNCYAERMAARFSGPGLPYEGLAGLKVITSNPDEKTGDEELRPYWTGEVKVAGNHLADPLRWQKPRRIFVNSMSDLFHDKLDDTVIAGIFGIMAAAPRHTFQVLTKRPERMARWFEWITPNEFDILHCHADSLLGDHGYDIADRWRLLREYPSDVTAWRWPLHNVWLGVSVENQAAADERIELLENVPARVKFLSCEPLLERVDLRLEDRIDGTRRDIQWVISGGESGPNARAMRVDWARSLREQCASAGVPFFHKQNGEYDWRGLLVGKKKAGSLLDGREHKEFPR